MLILTFEDSEEEILNHIISCVNTGARAFQVIENAKTNLSFNGLEIDVQYFFTGFPLWIPSQSRQKNSPKENVQVGRDNVVCIFVLLISGKYNRCRLVNVGGERCA